MKKKEIITKCQNCYEKDCELEEIIIDGVKKWWCDACRQGRNLELFVKLFKDNQNYGK